MIAILLTDCMFDCRCSCCRRSTTWTNNDDYLARIWRFERCRTNKYEDFDIFAFVTNRYPLLVIFWRFIELPKRLKGFALG